MDQYSDQYNQAYWAGDSAVSIAGESEANRQNRKRAEEQRQWNLEQWHRENAYNHPQQQMARLKEAGLNPHLMYGKGTVGNAGQVQGYNRAEAKSVTQGFKAFQQHQDFKQIQAQTNNIAAQADVAKEQAKYTAAKTVEQSANNEYAHEAAKANLDRLLAEKDIKTLELDTLTKTQTKRVEEINQRVENLKIQGSNLSLENQMKQFEADLNAVGLTRQDPRYWRLISTWWDELGNPSEWLDDFTRAATKWK